jgi:excisionase family DNA binding protein
MPDYVTTSQAAHRCGVSKSTVLRWIGSGLLQTIKTFGGHNRISLEELERTKKQLNLGTFGFELEYSVFETSRRSGIVK